jgi:hypothetical protein
LSTNRIGSLSAAASAAPAAASGVAGLTITASAPAGVLAPGSGRISSATRRPTSAGRFANEVLCGAAIRWTFSPSRVVSRRSRPTALESVSVSPIT